MTAERVEVRARHGDSGIHGRQSTIFGAETAAQFGDKLDMRANPTEFLAKSRSRVLCIAARTSFLVAANGV